MKFDLLKLNFLKTTPKLIRLTKVRLIKSNLFENKLKQKSKY